MSNPGAEALQALIDRANGVTGKLDVTISDAIESLVAGYGGDSSAIAIIDENTKYARIIKNPNATSGQMNRLFNASPIEIVYLGGYTDFANCGYMFNQNPNLKAVILPDATSLAVYMFWATNTSYSVPAVDLYKKQTFGSTTIFRLEQGGNIILRDEEMSTTNFNASTWGISEKLKFYVPQNLIQNYLADSNWSTFGDSRILPIEGSPYEDVNWWQALV